MPLFSLLFACAITFQQVGLVERDDDRMVLLDDSGRSFRLVLNDSSAPVGQLEGCGVRLTGVRLGRRLAVRDWRVIDGGDGSEPFVGRLERYGSHWIIADRNSGTDVALDDASLRGLDAHEGQLVLVVGYVVGTEQVRVVSWRALEP